MPKVCFGLKDIVTHSLKAEGYSARLTFDTAENSKRTQSIGGTAETPSESLVLQLSGFRAAGKQTLPSPPRHVAHDSLVSTVSLLEKGKKKKK